ncbi:MAG: hypothetical protein A3G87_03910 [Omnitrophica bacterium RIFCSPLOWO2_12_FULL_50_11]|nr:MAG: hypothetical protein A3G87_03910 [Omnitrophica bacterium RIFCSPLOWO2_12_FULL_50_11]
MAVDFFRFWKKGKVESKGHVAELSLFSALSPTELKLIEKKIRRVEYKKGDVVYRIGEPAEAFYIIFSGRFRVIGARGVTLTVLSQGDYFGESSILLGRPHSATVAAKNDGLLFKIDKEDFQNLLHEIPSLSLHLSRTLGHRLTSSTSGAEVTETKVLSIFGYGSGQERKMFGWNLAAMLGTNGKAKTIIVQLDTQRGGRGQTRSGGTLPLGRYSSDRPEQVEKQIRDEKGSFQSLHISNGVEGEVAEKQIASLLSLLIDRYDFVLLDLPNELDGLAVMALKQSDRIYFLVPEPERHNPKVRSYLKEFQTSFGFTKDEIRFILLEQQDGKYPTLNSFSLNDSLSVNIFCFLPHEPRLERRQQTDDLPFVLKEPESAYAKSLRFLSRELTGKLIGLALGSGAAFGYAHLGVLKVLEEERIPIDIVAGSSIGALIGALWAGGYNFEGLREIAKSLDRKTMFFKLVGFPDLSLPHRGFFKGHQVKRFLRNYLHRTTFRQLKVPMKVVAADLVTGEELIFDEGEVVEAIRASVSIPGIFRPVHMKDQTVIDGGVVDPLPIKVLSRYGVKKIIAVNVLPSSGDHAQRREYYEVRTKERSREIEKKAWTDRLFHALGERIRKRFRDNVFNVLMNSIQFLEYGIAESNAEGADILIHCALPNSHWAEFYSVDKFIRCGEERAREQLEDIKRLMEEVIQVSKV